jgi:hypothetical protein
MKKLSKILFIILMLGFVFQAGFAVYATVSGGTAETSDSEETVTEDDIVISQEVLDQIQAFDPDHYEKNVDNYKNLLISLNVHESFKQEIERLIFEGRPLPDLLIGYEFLYQSFGVISGLEPFVVQKASGASWETIFTEYNAAHKEFVPRAFDPDYLERLMSTPSITSDDIMIADRAAFVTGKTFQEVMEAKLEAANWKESTAREGILYSADKLPRVQITNEQIEKYTGQGLTENQIALAFVIAHKVGKEAQSVIEKIKDGYSEEAIYAESWTEKYL